MLRQFTRKFSASWLQSQLSKSSTKTQAILVHQSQIRSGELDGTVIPAGLS